jgi:hypothetical protein
VGAELDWTLFAPDAQGQTSFSERIALSFLQHLAYFNKGGLGPNTLDVLTPLMAWVESGILPREDRCLPGDKWHRHAHAAGVPIPGGRARWRLGQHRRCGEFHILRAGPGAACRL